MCLDQSIEVRLKVADTIPCKLRRPVGQRQVETPMDEKLYGLEIYESQITERHEMSAKFRLMVT
jgi:hypothetical protein